MIDEAQNSKSAMHDSPLIMKQYVGGKNHLIDRAKEFRKF